MAQSFRTLVNPGADQPNLLGCEWFWSRSSSAASSATCSTAASTCARTAEPAKALLRQDGFKPGIEALFIERTALLGIPFGEPLAEGAFQFRTRQRVIFVRIGSREQAGANDARGGGSRPAAGLLLTRARSSLCGWEVQDFGEFFRKLGL